MKKDTFQNTTQSNHSERVANIFEQPPLNRIESSSQKFNAPGVKNTNQTWHSVSREVYLQEITRQNRQFARYLLNSLSQLLDTPFVYKLKMKTHHHVCQNADFSKIIISRQILNEAVEQAPLGQQESFENQLLRVSEKIVPLISRFLKLYHIKVDLPASKKLFVEEFRKIDLNVKSCEGVETP